MNHSRSRGDVARGNVALGINVLRCRAHAARAYMREFPTDVSVLLLYKKKKSFKNDIFSI